ncbi:MAG: hypothetical protein WD114_02175, partial [Phycisphaerales bacterium]
ELAADHLRRSLELRRGQWSPGSREISSTEVALAAVLLALGELDEADAMAAAALEAMHPSVMARPIVRATRVRAQILRARGQPEQARAMLDAAATRLRDAGIDPEVIAHLNIEE